MSNKVTKVIQLQKSFSVSNPYGKKRKKCVKNRKKISVISEDVKNALKYPNFSHVNTL